MPKHVRWYILLLCVLIASGYAIGEMTHTQPLTPRDLSQCLVSKDPSGRAQCLHTMIEHLLATYSGAQIMDYISASTTPTDILYDCHPIGHILGNVVYAKYGSIDAGIAHCSSSCRSACTHGIIGAGVAEGMGEAFPDDNLAHATEAQLEAIGNRYCDKGIQTCHAVGHVAFIATNDPTAALKICDAVGHGPGLESCYEGVFMERAGSFYSVLSPADSITQPPTRAGDYAFPCDETDTLHKEACYLFASYYQQPLFAADGIVTREGKHAKEISVCESLPSPDRKFCFEGMGSTSYFFGTRGLAIPQMEAFCDQLPTLTDRNGCTKGITMQYLYFDRADGFAYCEGIQEESRRTYCYAVTFRKREASDNFKNDTERMCGGDVTCAERYAAYIASSTQPVAR